MGRRIQLIWSPQSKRDLKDIFAYIAKDDVKAAKEQVANLAKHASQLQYLPEMGKPARGVTLKNIRELVGGKYRIFYRLTDSKAHILAVWHSARPTPPSSDPPLFAHCSKGHAPPPLIHGS